MPERSNRDARFIVVEGPIGVGKTSLARRLAQSFESDLLLEGADENPFLERFYQDPRSGALPGCAAGSPTPSPMPRSRRAT